LEGPGVNQHNNRLCGEKILKGFQCTADSQNKIIHSFFCQQIEWGAVGLVLSGNVFIFCTILAYFLIFSGEDDWGF